MIVLTVIRREDMIALLGKRPFVGKSDDMDKWLDEHQNERRPTNPPIGTGTGEVAPGSDDTPVPAPIAASVAVDERIL